MAQQDQNGLGAIMAAQGELSSLNAARAQNSQAEQAFLQQQQAANAVMMQAAQIGTSGGLGQQVGAMNPQTQALLAQYGINGVAPQPGKTTSTNKTTQSGGNVKIENNTTTNNDIKIVNPPSQGGDGGNQAKFQTWLSNSFAKQNQEYEVQKRAFARRDRDLEKQSNKMMRELEKSTSSIGEKLNPQAWAAANGDQTKKVLGIILLTLAPKLIKPISDKLQDIFGFFNGDGGDDNDSKFEKKIKKILGFTQDDYDKKKGIGEKIGEIIGDKISRIEDTLKQQIDDRREAIASIEKPKRRLNGDKDAKVLWRLGDWMSYLGAVIPAALGGSKGRLNTIEEDIKDLGKDQATKSLGKEEDHKSKLEENIESGNYNYLTEDDFTFAGKLKDNDTSIRKAHSIIANVFESGNLTKNSALIYSLMSESKRISEENGETPIGKIDSANKFLSAWGWSVELLQEAENNEKKTYLNVRQKVLITGTINGQAFSKTFEQNDPELVKFPSNEFNKSFTDNYYYLTKDGFNRIEKDLPFKFGEASDLNVFKEHLKQKQLSKDPNKPVNFGEAGKLFEEYSNVSSQVLAHEYKLKEIQERDGASKRFEENFESMIIDPLWDLGEDAIKKARESFVTSEFGKIRTLFGKRREHKGIDLKAEIGTPIYSVSPGVVSRSEVDPNGYGDWVEVDHGDGTTTRYAHLSERKVNVGDKVNSGDIIALSGNTGGSTGPHLHYEVRKNNTPVDPAKETIYHYEKALSPVIRSNEDNPIQDPSVMDTKGKSTSVEIDKVERNSNNNGEFHLDAGLGLTTTMDNLLVSYDKKVYDEVVRNGGNISDITPTYYQLDEKGNVVNSTPFANNVDAGFFANISLKSLLSGNNYEGKNTDSDILGEYFLGEGIYLKEFKTMSDKVYNQMRDLPPEYRTEGKQMNFWASVSKDGTKIRQIRMEISFDTGVQLHPSSPTQKSGYIYYDDKDNWALGGDINQILKEFGPITIQQCHHINPICLSLGITLPRNIKDKITSLLERTQRLAKIKGKFNEETGIFQILDETTGEYKDWAEFSMSSIFPDLIKDHEYSGPYREDSNFNPGGSVFNVENGSRGVKIIGESNVLNVDEEVSRGFINKLISNGRNIIKPKEIAKQGLSKLLNTKFIRGVKTGYGDGDVVQSSQSSGTTTSTADANTQTQGVTIVDGGTVHNTYNTTINQYGPGNNPIAPTNS